MMDERIALVVDDSRSARFALRKYLEGHAFRVDTADSARAAYAWLQDQRPDLIFLDHVMPGEDGFAALRHLKADPQTAGIPVVICSSNEGSAFIAEARSQGASDVLQKPPSADQLLRILAQVESPANASAPEEPTAAEAAATAPSVTVQEAPVESGSVPVPEAIALPVAAQQSTAVAMTDTAAVSVDMDALRDAVDTLRGDLTTAADDHGQITQALEARANAIESRLSAIEQRLGGDLANARKHVDKELDALRRHSEKSLETLRQHYDQELDTLRRQQQQAMETLVNEHAQEREAQRQLLDNELRVVQQQFREELAQATQAARTQALQDIRASLLRALGES